MTFLDARLGWAVGDRGVVWHTSDGGARWSRQDTGVDCRLSSVWFLDREHGWIAGTAYYPYTGVGRGVLLHTRDGGRTWREDRRQMLPPLVSVRFFDARRGIVVGQPSDRYPGGVARTDDGGQSWSSVTGSQWSAWLAGTFVDPEQGLVVGRNGTLGRVGPRGLAPLAPLGDGRQHLRCAAQASRGRGASGEPHGDHTIWVAGDGGLLLASDDAGLTWHPPESSPLNHNTPDQSAPDQSAPDRSPLGNSALTGSAPAAHLADVDFTALAVSGTHVWIAGSPGTCIWHSSDAGRHWHSYATGQRLPIAALAFVDEHHGWAVGALGTILATRDGGRTWQRQAGCGDRAAVQFVVGRVDEVPLELVAHVSGSEGYLSVVDVIGCSADDEWQTAAEDFDDRLSQAVVAAGGSYGQLAWAFAVPAIERDRAAEAIEADWNLSHPAGGAAALEAHITRQIRIWRPDVLVVPAADPRGGRPLDQLVHAAALRAIDRAATALSPRDGERIGDSLGLDPWQVSRVWSVLPGQAPGTLTIATEEIAPRLGHSAADAALAARGCLFERLGAAEAMIGLSLAAERAPHAGRLTGLMSGLHVAGTGAAAGNPAAGPTAASAGNGAVRPAMIARGGRLDGDPAQLEQLRRQAEQHRQLRAVFEHRAAQAVGSTALLAQMDDLITQLDPRTAGYALFRLAELFHEQGQLDAAAQTMALLVARCAQHELVPAALRWLVRYEASSEMGHCARLADAAGTLGAVQPAVAHRFLGRAEPGSLPLAGQRGAVAPAGGLGVAGREGFAADAVGSDSLPAGNDPPSRFARAVHWADQLAALAPLVYDTPQVRFPLAVAQQQSGNIKLAQRYFRAMKQTRPRDAWWASAVSELWLAEPSDELPLLRHNCARVGERPYLDGHLDDAVWSAAAPLELTDPRAESDGPPARVWLCHDAEFLYLAAVCPRDALPADVATEGPRPRDADLAGHDRVIVHLDVDRDRATWYTLAVDERGWTAESCWHDANWNPTWFVARAADERQWTIEAAIPLAELIDPAAATHAAPQHAAAARSPRAWAIGIERRIPERGLQRWSATGTPRTVPEDFGLLIFE